jgi:Histidine kinase-, DNA gyrase B-, and HSP90-like ATPase
MAFKATPVHFSLKDVGSEIIDQLSADVYTGPASIMRELVKNAYDAFIPLDADVFEDSDSERQIVVSRERDGKNGRLLISDNGLGQDLTDLKANVQISISRKQQELENATGFRGLGSWAILGGGSDVVIATSKYGQTNEYKLTIDVREVYRILSPSTTLDDILNNKECISFSVSPREKTDHFTTVEIICDGPPSMVNGHELNRLYPFTDPKESELKNLLIRSCPLPYAEDAKHFTEISAIYDDVGYVPTPVLLDGTRLERRLPTVAGELERRELNVGKSKLAIAWFVEDPNNTGELTRYIRDHEHLLGGGRSAADKVECAHRAKEYLWGQCPRDDSELVHRRSSHHREGRSAANEIACLVNTAKPVTAQRRDPDLSWSEQFLVGPFGDEPFLEIAE